MRTLDRTIIELLESTARNFKAIPLNLGGIAGSGGGVGGPPGGFIGWLPQTRVAYDEDELATLDTPISGMSLLDNLNHIRYRIEELEMGGVGSGILVVDDNQSLSYNNTDEIHFSGAGVTVVDLGAGAVQVVIEATGSGGSPLIVEDIDGSPSVNNVDKIIFSGAIVTDLGDGDVLVQITTQSGVLDSATPTRQTMFAVNGNLSVQSNPRRIYNRTGQTLVIEKVYISTDNNGEPAGDSIIVDINKGVEGADPTTIFTTPANRPEIADGAEIGFTTDIDVASWADGEYLQMDIDQVGSSTVGSGLDVVIVARDTVPVIVYSGGSGSTTFLDLTDTPVTYAGQAGKLVVVNDAEDGLEFVASGVSGELEFFDEGISKGVATSLNVVGAGVSVTVAGGEATMTFSGMTNHIYNEDLTSQIPSSGYTTQFIYMSGTLRLYYNGLRQRKDYHYWEDGENAAFTVNFTTYSGDVIIVDYDYLDSDQYVDEWHFSEWGMFEYPFNA